jgi:hypothetical protein
VEHAPEPSADGEDIRAATATVPADETETITSNLPLPGRGHAGVGLRSLPPAGNDHRAAVVRTLQRRAGNAATVRWLARETLKEKVEKARASDPKGYVMKAVTGMAGKFTFEERVAEITWRMIWMFIPEKIKGTLVQAKADVKGIELDRDPPPASGDTIVLVGTSFVDGITEDNVETRVDALRLLFAGKEGLIAKAKADFGFAAVSDGTSSWTAGSLAQTLAGLQKLKAADRAALAGVTLQRNATGTAAMPTTGGTWVETGQFNFAVTTSPDAMTQTLQMFDDAFRTPDEAAWTAVHEAGHAVDSKRFRDTLLASNQAQTAFNATTAPSNAAGAAEVAALNAALRLTVKYPAPARTAAAAFIAAVRAVHQRLNALTNANTAAQLDAATTAVNSAIATRDAALAALAAGNPAATDFTRTIALQTAWLPLAIALATAAAKLTEARAAHTAASGASNPRISRRLERFLKVVHDNHIDPITPYAKAQWNANPRVPEDFFAEAYSMWLNDPKQLAAKAPALKDFFDHGEHLK